MSSLEEEAWARFQDTSIAKASIDGFRSQLDDEPEQRSLANYLTLFSIGGIARRRGNRKVEQDCRLKSEILANNSNDQVLSLLGELATISVNSDDVEEIVSTRPDFRAWCIGFADHKSGFDLLEYTHDDLALEILEHSVDVHRRAFRFTGAASYLESAVEYGERALELASPHAKHHYWRTALSNLYSDLYQHSVDPSYIERALRLAHENLNESSSTDPDYSTLLSNLAGRYSEAYESTGNLVYHERALEAAERAVSHSSPGQETHATFLANLSNQYRLAFRRTSGRQYIDAAIETGEAALQVVGGEPRARHGVLSNLGLAYQDRFSLTRRLADIHDAVSYMEAAGEELPAVHPDRRRLFGNLGSLYSSLYQLSGDPSTLDISIKYTEEALSLDSQSSLELFGLQRNHSLALADRYLDTHELEDLLNAIKFARASIRSCGAQFPEARVEGQVNLADLLIEQFVHSGDRSHLETARAALPTTTSGLSPTGVASLERTRASVLGYLSQPQRAVEALRRAMEIFDEEARRLQGDRNAQRDLAVKVEGSVGEMVELLLEIGKPVAALDVLGADRIWLQAPGEPAAIENSGSSVATVHVASGKRGTYMIAEGDPPTVAKASVARTEVRSAVTGVLQAVRHNKRLALMRFDRLQEVVSRITILFPEAEVLQIAPVGICSMLPYSSGLGPGGSRSLIDECCLSIAPTLGFAAGSRGASADSGSETIALLHDASENGQLDLDSDKEALESLGGTVRIFDEEPTSSIYTQHAPLRHFAWHFSCHGAYDHGSPMDSALILHDKLTIADILDAECSAWLVNLSSCESGVPDLARLEQSISFPTAFLMAGASHVLATSWSVLDACAAVYNQALYSQIALGVHPARSHRQAIFEVRAWGDRMSRSGRSVVVAEGESGVVDFDHPLWWSSFNHYGRAPI